MNKEVDLVQETGVNIDRKVVQVQVSIRAKLQQWRRGKREECHEIVMIPNPNTYYMTFFFDNNKV